LEKVAWFNTQVNIRGIKFYVNDQSTMLVSSVKPLKVLGSAVLGGELRQARYIFNHSVDKDYNGSNPEQDLRRLVEYLQLGSDVLGMMTAVRVIDTVLSVGKHKALSVAALCTAGVGNPGVAGQLPGKEQGKYQPGTINIILLIDGNLTDAAMVYAVITATEAKVRAIFDAKVSLPGGELVTGTTTDAIVVACTGRGELLRYAGTATNLGYMIGNTVYKAVMQGLNPYNSWSRGEEHKLDKKPKWVN
jgi:iron complex transport system ATP-binding protein